MTFTASVVRASNHTMRAEISMLRIIDRLCGHQRLMSRTMISTSGTIHKALSNSIENQSLKRAMGRVVSPKWNLTLSVTMEDGMAMRLPPTMTRINKAKAIIGNTSMPPQPIAAACRHPFPVLRTTMLPFSILVETNCLMFSAVGRIPRISNRWAAVRAIGIISHMTRYTMMP